VIGYLSNAKPESFTVPLQAFRQGLAETGYVEGRNVAIEYRWAEGDADQLPRLAADLVGRKVAVIVATGGNAPARAAKAATAKIPIVFTGGGDPVKLGLVESLGHPGGNATGVLNFSYALTAKRLALLRELVPGVTLIAVLVNSASSDTEREVAEIEEVARSIGQPVRVVTAGSEKGPRGGARHGRANARRRALRLRRPSVHEPA
jgi:putative ABC transport system substrate-binding protein